MDVSQKGWRRRHGAPKNRRQLFLCVLTDQLFSLPPINLLYLFFYLPAVLLTLFALRSLLLCMEGGTAADAVSYLQQYVLLLIPCLAVTGPPRAGMALLMRNWAREEDTPPFRTFFRGMRENWKEALLISFVTGLFPAALFYAYLASAGKDSVFSLLLMLACLIFFLFLLSQQVLYSLLVTYRLPLRAQLRNAFLLTLLKLPRAFFVFLGAHFVVLLYVGFSLIRPEMRFALLILPILYYAFCGAAVTELAYASYANLLFDTYLTPKPE